MLHQENSNPGHVGQWFVRNGYTLDIRKPRFGDPLPGDAREPLRRRHLRRADERQRQGRVHLPRRPSGSGWRSKEEKPFLGICLGAQMLANHLGAKVGFHPEELAEIGYYPLVTTAEGGSASGPSPITSISGTAKASSWRAARGCSPRPPAPTPIRPSPTAAAIGVQFHPEITYAQVHRWTGPQSTRASA